MKNDVSDELLNAFVDGQLDDIERGRVLSIINDDPAVGKRAFDLWRLKEMVQHALPMEPVPQSTSGGGARWHTRWPTHAIAAGLIAAVGVTGGWFARGPLGTGSQRDVAQVAQVATMQNHQKVLLHIGSSNPVRIKAILDEAEQLLRSSDSRGDSMQVEVVANEGGLDMLRAGISPYAERIQQMRHAHKNLSFVACGNTVERLRNAGEDTRLLPHTLIASSAIDEIVTRQRQGWLYIGV